MFLVVYCSLSIKNASSIKIKTRTNIAWRRAVPGLDIVKCRSAYNEFWPK